MTSEELKAVLSTPLALFVLMLSASLGSALKQMWVARKQDVSVRFGDYFLAHWPETLIMLGTNVGSFIGLVMTDSLNWASAIGIGYLANDAADAFTKQGRSAEIQSGKQSGFARVGSLAFLATAALCIVALSSCGGTRQLYSHASSPVQYAKAVLLHHNAIGEQIADMREDPLVSEASKAALLKGYRLTVCSAEEISRSIMTSACRTGPAQRTEAAAKAVETLSTAQTQQELQEAVDALVAELVKLITLVNEAR